MNNFDIQPKLNISNTLKFYQHSIVGFKNVDNSKKKKIQYEVAPKISNMFQNPLGPKFIFYSTIISLSFIVIERRLANSDIPDMHLPKCLK